MITSTAVVPVPLPGSSAQASEAPTITYYLVPAEPLPTVDTSLTLRRLVLGETWSCRHVAFMRRFYRLFLVFHFVGLAYRFYGMLVPSRYSFGWWLVLASVLQLPSATSVALSLKYELLRHLAKSFEFWFFSAINIVWGLALAVGYNDVRASLCLVNWLELENAKATDANLHGLQHIVVIASLWIVVLVAFIVGIVLNRIELAPTVAFTTPRGHAVLVKDILVNTMATIVLLLARLVYHRHDAVRQTTATPKVQCVTCRCRLKLTTLKPSHPSSAIGIAKPGTMDPQKLRMECAVITEEFPAANTVLRADLCASFHWWWYPAATPGLGLLIGLSIVSLDRVAPWLLWTTLVLTAVGAAPLIALHQRQLLRRLFGSFDFVFLLTQFISACVCLGHLVAWNEQRVVLILGVTLWFYVTITFDALTPDTRRRLHWTPRRAAFVAFLLLLATVAFVLELALWGAWDVPDRVLLDWNVFGSTIKVSGIPFLLSRLAILVIWNARLVWRLATCGSDELVMLLGAVQYEHQRRPTRRGAVSINPVSR